MQDDSSLEGGGPRSAKGGAAGGPLYSDAALNNRMEALKVLVRMLLKEVESLAATHTLESGREVKLRDEVSRFEIGLIRSALIRTGGRQRRAARLLNVKVSTLHSKIKRYNLEGDELINIASGPRQGAE
jgi:DNA-binding NtrC family response regulator